MKRIGKFVALSTLSAVLSTGAVMAQDDHRNDRHDDHRDDHRDDRRDDHRDNGNAGRRGDRYDNHRYVRHDDWRKGARMRHEDWDRGDRVDYRTYRLRRPPRGYEWRQVDGSFVMAAIATGLIASIVIASAAH